MMKLFAFALLSALFLSTACGKKSPAAPPDTAPTNLTIQATVNADSSGNVSFVASATGAVTYDYDFGNGVFQTVPDGKVTYKYTTTGSYTVNVIAKSQGGKTTSQSTTVQVIVKTSLLWSDEFDTPGAPDPAKWGYDIGTGSNGWGNNELEYYTSRPDNVIISNGTLKIIAKKESYNGSAYTSTRMLTNTRFSFKYGKIEIRAKLPAGKGTWPGIWMLGNNIGSVGWPACGEIDIMEQNGSSKTTVYGTMHYPTQKNPNGDGGTTTVNTATSDFHRYTAIWSATSIQLQVDDVTYYTLSNNSGIPFNQNFFIILNVAMGGNFGGSVDPGFTSDQMEIDYVRVYQ